MQLQEVGKFLITAGFILAAVGLFFLVSDKIPLGKLPGDIHIEKENFHLFIPVATCILLSIVVTLVMNFLSGK